MSTNLVLLWGLNNCIIRPWVVWMGGDMPMIEIPPEFWSLIMMGFGVYGGARSFEKITSTVAGLLLNKSRRR